MRLQEIRDKLVKKGFPTPLGWIVLIVFIFCYYGLKHLTAQKRANRQAAQESSTQLISPPADNGKDGIGKNRSNHTPPQSFDFPTGALPASQTAPPPAQSQSTPATPARQYNQPSFGNLNSSGKILSDDFLPKGTILYATLTSDIVSNNQASPATATIIHPAIFAHKVRIPVGTQMTGKIAPGNLRGRVFVTWDTLIFYEEGRQGWELPIKGVGMTYEQNTHSARWIINGAGLKGFVFDDSAATAFKLAGLKALQDFAKTLQTYVTTQNSAVTSGSVVTTTTTTPEATLQNSGLGAAQAFIDVIAQRYAATLQQQNSYVLVPTARLCAVFLDESIDISTAAPGRSMQAGTR